ncbi:MAG: cohesin domain-containing protein [Chloroflexota bacterium]|nr:cohesin domain-containing protein [Chloroflexota bacterium]
MRSRNLSIAALAVALVTAVILSWLLRPVFQVTAIYRADRACEELVENGGFETDEAWEIPDTAFSADYSDEAHSGERSMRLGIPPGYPDSYAYSSVYQDVTIPFEAESATFSFWYKPYTVDSSGWDRQYVLLYDTSGSLRDTALWGLYNSGEWTHHTFDVSSYAGETLRLYFGVYNNSYYYYGRTWMYVDDVSLEWCREATPTPTGMPTDTPTPTNTPTSTPTPTGTPMAELAFSPSYQTVFTHTAPYTFTTNVVISDVVDLAGFEFDVVYDPTVVRIVDMILGDFLESTGREVDSLSEGIDSRWSFRAWSGNDHPAPEGSGVLATTFLSPIAIGEMDLAFENAQLANTEPVTIPFDTDDPPGHIEVSCFGDCNGDEKVDVLDLIIMAKHWFCEYGQECYDAIYDVDGNGEIRATDIMQVAVHWGPCESGASAFLEGAKVTDVVTPTVRIKPSEASVCVGLPFTVTVEISDAVDLGSFELELNYDPKLVQVDQVALGGFLGSTGRDVMDSSQIDNENGVTKFDALSYPPGAGPEGKGDLAHIWLTARSVGESDLILTNVQLLDTQAEEQESNVQSGAVKASGGVYLPLIMKE